MWRGQYSSEQHLKQKLILFNEVVTNLEDWILIADSGESGWVRLAVDGALSRKIRQACAGAGWLPRSLLLSRCNALYERVRMP